MVFRIGGRRGRGLLLDDADLGARLDLYRSEVLSRRFGCVVSRPFAAGVLLMGSSVGSFKEASQGELRAAIRGGLDLAGVEG